MPELSWRQKNPERAKEYRIKYYHTVLKDKRRRKGYGDKKCRLCEILMRSEYGAHKNKFYCNGCMNGGGAAKHWKRIYDQKRYYNKKFKND